jgi:hypothetical protein
MRNLSIDTESHLRDDGRKPKYVANDVADWIRIFRNLIHPAAELRQGYDPPPSRRKISLNFREMYKSVTHSLFYYI